MKRNWNIRVCRGSTTEFVQFNLGNQVITVNIPVDRQKKRALDEVIKAWWRDGFHGHPPLAELI